jgi:integrase/recombinase XerD
MKTQDEEELRKLIYTHSMLKGFSEVTSYNYFLSCRAVLNHIGKSAPLVSDVDLKTYFCDYLQTQPAPKTIGARRAALRFLYNQVLHIKHVFLEGLQVPKQQRLPACMSMEEVELLLRSVRLYHYRVIINLAFSCGLRVSEVVRVKISDINKYKKTLFVEAGKGRKDRYIPLPQKAYQMLRSYWALTRPVKPYIFVNPRTQRHYSTGGVQLAFREARNTKELNQAYTFHTLRHSYATCLLDAGLDIRILQMYMGHSHLKTTMLYLHITPLARANAEGILSKLFESFSYHA